MAGTDGGLTLAPPAIPFGLVTIGTKTLRCCCRGFFFFFFPLLRGRAGEICQRTWDVDDGKRREMVMKKNRKSLTRQYIHCVRHFCACDNYMGAIPLLVRTNPMEKWMTGTPGCPLSHSVTS